jgi:diguanylate cyclase (GGDEF)-like protein/PAS domain S-box-containing protein
LIEKDGSASDISAYGIRKDIGSISKTVEFEQLISLSCDLFCCMDSNGWLLYVNESWAKTCGYTAEIAKHINLQSITVPEDIPVVFTELLKLDEQAETTGITIRLRCTDGSCRPFVWSARRSGDLIYATGHVVTALQELTQPANNYLESVPGLRIVPAWLEPTDGSSQKYPELNNELNNMLVNPEYLRAILEKSQDAFFANYCSKIIDANEAFFHMIGYEKEDLPLIGFEDFVGEESLNLLYSRLPLLFMKGNDRFEAVNKKRDGSQLDVEVLTSVINMDPPVSVCFMRDITERKNSERKLVHAHELMRYIIEHNRIAVAVHDKNLNYMYVSRRYVEFFGLEGQEIIGKHHYEIIPQLSEELKEVHKRVLSGEIVASGDIESSITSGSFVKWECRPWFEEDGTIGGLILYIEDVTERKRMERMLIDEKEHFRTTLLSVGDGVISTNNNGIVTVMNPVAERLTGWTLDEAVGRKLDAVLQIVNEQSAMAVTAQYIKIPEMGKTDVYRENHLVVSKTGNAVPAEINAAPIRLKSGNIVGSVIIIRDFTEKRLKQRQIEFLSYHDELTGLYNRRYMDEIMSQLEETCSIPLTLMVVDVNGLKLVNDAFGHEMGDKLLRTVAGVLREVCKPTDIICRMGGDEICIILHDTGTEKALEIKQEILSKASTIKMENIVVSLAIGYAVKSLPEQKLIGVMTAADNQMYQDKIKFGKVMRSQTIQAVITNINLNYEREQIHNERVSYFCEAIAKMMGLSDTEIRDIKTAGALHDIGKIMVAPKLLNKPGRLTNEEFELVKRHPEIGYQLLKPVDEYAHLAQYVLYHHERWDGTGYPIGLEGESIPLYSRIIAIADAYEAMTAERPYQLKKTKEEAVAELSRCAGSQFDSKIVELFVKNIL